MPRVLPDGSRNAFALQRLKDKLGNRSNASSEVEFDDTVGWLVGEPGRGVRTIIDMVTMTRLDCVIGSAAVQRAALTQALHHVARPVGVRRPAGRPAADAGGASPTWRSSRDAATQLFLRLADAVDQGETSLLRIAVAAAKYWVCKRTPAMVGEALECLGGAGYVEESPLPRYFRESPLNSIWEGSGNVIALDVLRALGREPDAVEALLAELAPPPAPTRGWTTPWHRLAGLLRRGCRGQAGRSGNARQLAGLLARTLQGSLLVRRGRSAGDAAGWPRHSWPPGSMASAPAVFG